MIIKKKKPAALYVLIFLLFFQSISAIYGGFSMIMDPSGALLKLELGILGNTPFQNFFFPGLLLALILGVLPLLLIYPLLAEPHWRWTRKLNIYKNRYWAWSYSLYVGLGLNIWMDFQFVLVGRSSGIQILYAVLGLLIVVFTLWPSVMKYYRRSRRKSIYDGDWSPDGQEKSQNVNVN
jgi:hypothetical protein